jgi:putative flippase GtrA
MRTVNDLLRHRLTAELAPFGAIGALCLVTDIVLFNLLVFRVGVDAVPAKAATMVVTGVMAFVGHRHVTFRHRQGNGLVHEAALFTIVTAVSLLAGLAPIWFVGSVLDQSSALWLNAANLLGIGLGAVIRFLAYRHVVWAQGPPETQPG